MTLGVSNLQVLILHSSPEETLGILTLPPLSLPPPPGFCYSVHHFYAIRTCSICIRLCKNNSRLFGLDLYSKGSSPLFHRSIISVLCALTPLVSDLISLLSNFFPLEWVTVSQVWWVVWDYLSCYPVSEQQWFTSDFLRFIFIYREVWAVHVCSRGRPDSLRGGKRASSLLKLE